MEGKYTSLSFLDCTVVYYIKQLSPSDAASSKQIKLPKTEARRFCGDLRHKQRSMVTVLDDQHVCWEFLCTCYGCQYALSRVAVFCNTYQLRAGQYLLFYRDSKKRLRIAVTGSIPPNLLQQVGSGGHHLKRSYSQMAAAHPVSTDDYAAPAVAATDACSAQQQQQQQHSPGAEAADAIRQSSRDQMCMQKEVKQPQLMSPQADAFKQQQEHNSPPACDTQQQQQQQQQQQHLQQFNIPHACYSQQQQHMSPVAEAASLHAAAEVHVFGQQQQQQQQGSPDSSDSSSSRQLLSVSPEARILGGGGLGSGSSRTPTSTAAGGLTGMPAWHQSITQQQQQQQGNAALPLSSATAAAAAATRRPPTVAAWDTAAAAGAACTGAIQHAKGIEVTDDTAAASAAAAAANTSVAATVVASKASNSPGSCLVCHEQLLDSPSATAAAAAAASQLLVKARAKQRSSSQTERLKLKWKVANSSAVHSNAAAGAAAAAAAVSIPCHTVASSGCLPGSSSTQGVEQKMLMLPKDAAGPSTSTTATQCAALPKQFTQGQSYALGSSSKLLAMHIDNSGRHLEHNSNGRNSITCTTRAAGSSTNSTLRAHQALLPKIRFKQQQSQQQQQLVGCASTVTLHPRTDAGGAQLQLLNQQTSQQLPAWGPDKQCTGSSAPGWGPDKQYTGQGAPGWGPGKQYTSQGAPGWGPDKQYTSPGAPGWGPDKQYAIHGVPGWGPHKQYTGQGAPGWGPDKQYTIQSTPGWGPDKQYNNQQYNSSKAPPTALPTAAELPLPLDLNTSVTGSNTAHNAAAEAAAEVGGNISSTAQSAETQNTFGCGLLLSASSQWQLHLSDSSSNAGSAAGEPARKRLRGAAPDNQRKMAPRPQQPDIAAKIAQGQNRPRLASAAELVALHASKLVDAYSRQQHQQPLFTAVQYRGKGSHTLASSTLKVPQLRVPHGFGKSISSISSKAAAGQQRLDQLQQTPHHAARSDHMGSQQLLPLFKSGPRLGFPAAASLDLHGRGMRAAATGSARLAHAQELQRDRVSVPLPQQQQQQQLHATSTYLQSQQQQLAFEADEWSAVSSLLMLAQHGC